MVATHKLDPEKNTPTILAQYYALDLGKARPLEQNSNCLICILGSFSASFDSKYLRFEILAHTEAVLEHFRIYGHVKVKARTAKEKQEREDPYR